MLRSNADQATPFHQLGYLNSIADAVGCSVFIFVCSLSDKPVAGAALLVRRRAGVLKEVVLPPFTPYSAIVLPAPPKVTTDFEVKSREADNSSCSVVIASLFEAIRTSANLVRIHLSPKLKVNPSSLDRSWIFESFQTYVSALDRDSPLKENWSQNPKRILKKHQADFRIRNDAGAATIAQLLNQNSYARHDRTPLLAADAVVKLITAQVASKRASIFVANHIETNSDDAAIVLLRGPLSGYYWIVGSKPGPAMTVLINHVLQYCADEGICLFDFVGANTPSIADFKRRFGPELVSYQGITSTRPKVVESLRKTARRLRS